MNLDLLLNDDVSQILGIHAQSTTAVSFPAVSLHSFHTDTDDSGTGKCKLQAGVRTWCSAAMIPAAAGHSGCHAPKCRMDCGQYVDGMWTECGRRRLWKAIGETISPGSPTAGIGQDRRELPFSVGLICSCGEAITQHTGKTEQDQACAHFCAATASLSCRVGELPCLQLCSTSNRFPCFIL